MEYNELLQSIAQLFEENERKVHEEILGIKVTIENDVTKRIDALFDGYKNTHEKQWELERKVEMLEKRIEHLENLQNAG